METKLVIDALHAVLAKYEIVEQRDRVYILIDGKRKFFLTREEAEAFILGEGNGNRTGD